MSIEVSFTGLASSDRAPVSVVPLRCHKGSSSQYEYKCYGSSGDFGAARSHFSDQDPCA